MQSEAEYQKVLDTFKTFSQQFGLKTQKDALKENEIEQD